MADLEALQALGQPFPRHATDALWDAEITDNSDTAHTTTFIGKFLTEILQDREYDESLFSNFREAFQGWTVDLFNKAERRARTKLKEVLRERGIFLPYLVPGGTNLSEQFFDLLTRDDFPRWSDDEVNKGLIAQDSAIWRRRQDLLPIQWRRTPPRASQSGNDNARPARETPQEISQTIEGSNNDNQQSDIPAETPEGNHDNGNKLSEPYRQAIDTILHEFSGLQQRVDRRLEGIEQINRNAGRGNQPQQLYREGTAPATGQYPTGQTVYSYPQARDSMAPMAISRGYNEYRDLPPRSVQTVDLDHKMITDFTKIWGAKEKYDGKPYNLLDFKMLHFFNICKAMKIHLSGYHSVFPYILTGQAESYYLTYLTTAETFAQIYDTMKTHFEHDVNLAQYHTDWSTTRFLTMMTKKKEEDTPMDVLNKMIDKLMLCQRAMGRAYDGEPILREQVRAAVTGVREFEYALQKPDITCEGFFSQLRSSLATVMARTTTTAQMNLMDTNFTWNDSADTNPLDTALAFYVDRKYNSGRNSNFQKSPRGQSGWKGSGSGGQRGFQKTTGFDKSKTRYRDRDHRTNNPDWKNRCFVCGKEGCWSTNHTIQERHAARTQYFTEFPEAGQAEYASYVLGYEGDEIDKWQDTTADEQTPSAAPTWMMNSSFETTGQAASQ